MQYISQFRSIGVFAFILMLTASILTGCSDNSTDPSDPDVDPLAADASAEVSDPVGTAEGDSVRNNARRNAADSSNVAIDSCIANVKAENPGCEVLGVNVDYDRDTAASYVVIIRENGKVYEVTCDPKTGKQTSKKEITNYYYTETIVITRIIRVQEANERSRQYVRGDVVEVSLENINGRPTYVIVVLTRDNRYVTIYMDAETGQGRRVGEGSCGSDNDDDDNDNDGKKKKKHGRGHYRRHGHGHQHHGNGHGYGHEYRCHCTCEDEDPNPTDTTNVTVISQDSARALVASYVDSATVTETKLVTGADSSMTYEIKLSRDSARYEVKLNAINGVFISAGQTAGNMDSNEFRPPTIRRDSVNVDSLVVLSVARTAAIAQFPGTVTSWKLEYDTTEAKWIYTFEIQPATGDRKKVLVDAKTGVYIRTI
jgi:uncharacterized membrane protein YkoI